MKRLWLIGSIVAIVGLLIAGFAAPIFAHSPDDGEVAPANSEAWEAMHESCEDGDWEAMAETAEEVHGEGFDHMSYRGGMGSHMGGGMMSGGWGGMM